MGRKKTNAIHGYFEYNENNKTSTCAKCNKILKGNHSSNLLRHFYTQHRDYYDEITQINHTNPSLANNAENATTSNITKCCLDLITIHGRPFSMLEDEAFQELLKMIPNAKGFSVSGKSIKDLIGNKAYEIRKKIFAEVQNKLIALKTDVGSIKTRRFLGLNIQYIHEDKIVLRNLGVIELHESNTGRYLKDTILCILSQLGIEIKQIYSITTDNGLNMLSMSRQLEEALEGDFETEHEISSEHFLAIDESDYLQLTNDLQFDIIPEESSEVFKPKLIAVRCAAHTLQLAVNDALREIDELLTIVRQAARALRAPNMATELRNQNLLQALIDCPTRWDSTADMLERITSLKLFCQTRSDDRINLTDSIWEQIENTLEALTPCRVLSKRLQSEQITFGDFYISWTQCILEMEKLETPFALLVTLYMKERQKIMFENESFLAALYLDPRVNCVLQEEQLSKAKEHLAATFQRLLDLNTPSDNETVNDEQQSARNSREFEDSNSSGNTFMEDAEDAPEGNQNRLTKEVDSFLQEMHRRRNSNCERTQFNIRNTMEDFLKEALLESDQNILQYWGNKKLTHPQLYYLANTILSTPPTQVSVERLFSSLKFVMSNLRMSLKDNIINDILVIRNNNLYDK